MFRSLLPIYFCFSSSSWNSLMATETRKRRWSIYRCFKEKLQTLGWIWQTLFKLSNKSNNFKRGSGHSKVSFWIPFQIGIPFHRQVFFVLSVLCTFLNVVVFDTSVMRTVEFEQEMRRRGHGCTKSNSVWRDYHRFSASLFRFWIQAIPMSSNRRSLSQYCSNRKRSCIPVATLRKIFISKHIRSWEGKASFIIQWTELEFIFICSV